MNRVAIYAGLSPSVHQYKRLKVKVNSFADKTYVEVVAKSRPIHSTRTSDLSGDSEQFPSRSSRALVVY